MKIRNFCQWIVGNETLLEAQLDPVAETVRDLKSDCNAR
jgi:hypothetical protein